MPNVHNPYERYDAHVEQALALHHEARMLAHAVNTSLSLDIAHHMQSLRDATYQVAITGMSGAGATLMAKTMLQGIVPDGWNVHDSINHDADATVIVLMTSGSDIDIACRDYIRTTMNSMSDAERHNVLFALTHTSAPDFRHNRKAIVKSAHHILSEYFGETDATSRIVAVDSLAEMLYLDMIESKDNVRKYLSPLTPAPSRWPANLWPSCLALLNNIEDILRNELDEEVLNETLLHELKQQSHYDDLITAIKAILANKKANRCRAFINLLAKDVDEMIRTLQRDVNIWSACLSDKASLLRQQYDEAQQQYATFQTEFKAQHALIQQEFGIENIRQQLTSGELSESSIDDLRNAPSSIHLSESAHTKIAVAQQILHSMADRLRTQSNTLVATLHLDLDPSYPAINFDNIPLESATANAISNQAGDGISKTFEKFKKKMTESDTDKAKNVTSVIIEIKSALIQFRTTVCEHFATALAMIDESAMRREAQLKEHVAIQRRKSDISIHMLSDKTSIEQLEAMRERIASLTHNA